MAELKNCPCCGGKAEMKISESAVAYAGNVYLCRVRCTKCGLEISENFVDFGLKGEVEEMLADTWNRRVKDD